MAKRVGGEYEDLGSIPGPNIFFILISLCRSCASLIQTLTISRHRPTNASQPLQIQRLQQWRIMVYSKVSTTWDQTLTGLAGFMGLDNFTIHPLQQTGPLYLFFCFNPFNYISNYSFFFINKIKLFLWIN